MSKQIIECGYYSVTKNAKTVTLSHDHFSHLLRIEMMHTRKRLNETKEKLEGATLESEGLEDNLRSKRILTGILEEIEHAYYIEF